MPGAVLSAFMYINDLGSHQSHVWGRQGSEGAYGWSRGARKAILAGGIGFNRILSLRNEP